MSNGIYTPYDVTLSVNSANVGFVKQFTWTAPKRNTEDVTNFNSPMLGPGYVKQIIPTTVDPGSFKADVFWIPNDAGLTALYTAFNTANLANISVQLGPDINGNTQTTTGDSWTWQGYINDCPEPDAVDPTKPLSYTLSCTMNTVPVRTAGS